MYAHLYDHLCYFRWACICCRYQLPHHSFRFEDLSNFLCKMLRDTVLPFLLLAEAHSISIHPHMLCHLLYRNPRSGSTFDWLVVLGSELRSSQAMFWYRFLHHWPASSSCSCRLHSSSTCTLRTGISRFQNLIAHWYSLGRWHTGIVSNDSKWLLYSWGFQLSK